jgi:hypothetical protein
MHRRLDRLTLKPDSIARSKAAMRFPARRCHGKRTRNSNGGLARRPPVFPGARQGAPAVGANHDRIDHGDGSCRGLDVGPERAAALYGARLGLDMALDRSHPTGAG